MNLHDVHRGIQKHKKRRRVGRGKGSGWGKTSGRGHKGQGQLAGWTAHPAFEGGQFPLARRVPKRGFHNRHAATVGVVNLADLERSYQAGEVVNVESLQAKDLLKGRFDQIKVLGDGQLTKKLKIEAHKFSKSALEKIQQAGAEAVMLPLPAPVVKFAKKVRKPKPAASSK